MTADWIDISVPIYSGMVHWPDNPAVRIERIQDLSRGDAANVSKLELGAHTGTHMDAPRHFLADGAGIWLIEGLNLDAVEPGAYELVCLPLRVVGADGAPARAILRPRGRRESRQSKVRGREGLHGKGRK